MKRFTETTKWGDPWFRKLAPKHKLLWQWLCDNCDSAGVLDPDWDIASLHIGAAVDADDIDPLAGRVTILGNGKLWVSGFIAFQYGKLSRDCKPHGPIFISLEKHGIDPDSASENQRVSKGYPKGIHTLQEKEKETDKEKEKENTPQKSKPKAKASTPEEAEFFAASIGCTPGQGEAFFWKMEGNGWCNGGRPVKDWQATVRAWKAAGYLPVPEVKATTRPHAGNHEPADMSIENTMRAMGATEEDIQHRLEFVARNLQQKSA